MTQFVEQLKAFFGRLSAGQLVALGLVVVGTISMLIFITTWATQPDYTLLFGNLEVSDANGVVQALQEENIPYELTEQGSAILVPREHVHELRLRYAGSGLVSRGQVGYELFDGGTLGMTDFMQKLNHKRALEGELARTIATIDRVELARVHLVIPERNPFREAQSSASASVVLQLRGAGTLSRLQVNGITALVAGAVGGLVPSDVTILDTEGRLLSDPNADDQMMTLTSTQLEMKQTLESYLAQQGQSMLDQIIGPGNAIVRVAANLDFSRSIAEKQLIDPESQTVISEEEMEETGAEGGDATSMVRNYAVSRTNVRSEESVGDVEYLTVSVIIDYKLAPVVEAGMAAESEAASGDTRAVPRSEEQLQKLEDLVKNAVGYSPNRGDRFVLHQTRFSTSVNDQVASEFQQRQESLRWERYGRYGLMLLAMLLVFFLLRSASKRILNFHPTPVTIDEPLRSKQVNRKKKSETLTGNAGETEAEEEDEDELVLIDDIYTSKLSKEAKARLKAKHMMYEEIQQQAVTNPDEVAELIRNWLAADARAEEAGSKQPVA